jgi:hypothetical protein
VSLATIGGHTVNRARVAWPTWGLWWADVDSPDPAELEGRQALTIASTTFSGTVVRGGAVDGRSAYRLVAGAGGVSKPLPKRGYVNDAGVALSNVLADAAREAGETLVTAGLSTRLGPHYARQAGETLGDLLQRHAPQAWYADADGALRLGTRAASTYAGTAPRTKVDPLGAVVDLVVESLEDLAPGVQVDGNNPASDLQIDLTPERLTVRVYSGKTLSRRLRAYARIVRAIFPSLAYAGVWEYRVVTQTGERMNLQPARVASGMPNLVNVPVRPGVPGVKATVLPGELVLVCFADCDPSRPQVFAHDAADSVGWQPLSFQIGGPAALGIAYQGSPVQAGPFAGAVTLGSARFKVSPV